MEKFINRLLVSPSMVQIYDVSQQYKARIEQSPKLMGALKLYAQFQPDDWEHPMEQLGQRGWSNVHYRLGQLDSGLFIATREHLKIHDGQVQRMLMEHYARNLESAYNSDKTTSKLVIGSRIHVGNPEDDSDRYFLLLEDFMKGGQTDFKPGRLGEISGTIDGKVVAYDFTEDGSGFRGEFKFMHDDAMIHIRPDR